MYVFKAGVISEGSETGELLPGASNHSREHVKATLLNLSIFLGGVGEGLVSPPLFFWDKIDNGGGGGGAIV